MDDVKIIFSAETNAAAAAVQKLVGGVRSQFEELAAVVTAAFSVHAIKEWIGAQIETEDQAGKTAQKVGISTEAVSAYAFAAKLANVEQGEFNLGLKTLAQNVADAARKGQMLAGVQVQVNGVLRSLDEILPDIADRFASMPDGIQKTDLAVQLFGRAGQNLIPLLNEGSEGLARMREEAARTGNVISGETAKSAAELNDKLSLVRAQVKGLGLAIAQELLPYLQHGADAMNEFTAGAERRTAIVQAFMEVLKSLALVIALVVLAFVALGQSIGIQLSSQFGVLFAGVNAAIKLFQLWWDSSQKLDQGLDVLISTVGDLGTVLRKLATGDFAGAAASAQASLDRTKESLAGIGGALADNFIEATRLVVDFIGTANQEVATGQQVVMEKLKADWVALKGVFNTLFGAKSPEMLGPPAPGRNQGNVSLDNAAATKASQDMLAAINEAYRQAMFSKLQILQQDHDETTRLLRDRIMTEKNLNSEDLQNDEDYQIAKLQLDATYAKQRADLAEETKRKLQDQALDSNDVKQAQVNAAPGLSEQERLLALMPLLEQRNQLLQQAIDESMLLAQAAELSTDKQIENQQRLNQLLKSQSDTQKSIRDAEKAINDQRLTGTRNMFSDMATAAKAFGKEGLVAYKAFASAAVAVDTAKAAMGAYAAMASIPYVGPALGIIAAAAAVAAGIAQIAQIASIDAAYAEGGLVEGPGTSKSDSIPARLSNGEFVMRADAVQQYGLGFMESLNQRQASLRGLLTNRMTLRNQPITSSAERLAGEAPGMVGGGGGAAAQVNVQAPPAQVFYVDSQKALREFLESNAGRNIVVNHVRASRDCLGFDT